MLIILCRDNHFHSAILNKKLLNVDVMSIVNCKNSTTYPLIVAAFMQFMLFMVTILF